MTKAVRRIKRFDFSGEGAHVALVDKAANGQTVLLMKSASASEDEIQKALSKDVTVKMTIMEFLTRYLNLYYDDAEVVAGLLGYSSQDISEGAEWHSLDSWAEYIEEKLSNIQINKSAEGVDSHSKLVENLETFKSKYLSPDLSSSVASEGGDVVTKAEDVKSNNEEVEMTQEEIQAMIAKAAEEQANERIEALEKAYAERAEKSEKELSVLKAAHESRVHAEYLAKAEELAQYAGEGADKEALAKSLRAVEALEEAAPVLAVLKSLQDVAGKQELLEEVGKSADKDQPTDFESKVVAVAKSLRESDPTLSDRQAEIKAYEQLYSAQ